MQEVTNKWKPDLLVRPHQDVGFGSAFPFTKTFHKNHFNKVSGYGGLGEEKDAPKIGYCSLLGSHTGFPVASMP